MVVRGVEHELKAWRHAWQHATVYLFFCSITFVLGGLVYGLDTGSFGSLQTLPSFLRRFGTEHNGTYSFSTRTTAIANSVVFVGRFVGALFLFEPLVQRLGYRLTALVALVIQLVAVTVEVTAHTWQVFTVGRTLAYMGVGILENVVPSYQAEIAPAPLRGLIAGSIMTSQSLGKVWGAGMSKAYATNQGNGWMVVVAVAYIPAGIMLMLLPFTVESPRWLLLQGKKDAAVKSLHKLRPRSFAISGSDIAELDHIERLIDDAKAAKQGRWIDLVRGNNFRRVNIAAWMFFFQQVTATQVINSYGPTLFKNLGLGARSFTLQTINNALAVVASFLALIFTDRIGRRPLLIAGTFLTILFNSLVAGLGERSSHTTTETNTIVASVLLSNFSAKFSLATQAYLIASEIGGVAMRKKIIAVGTGMDAAAAWAATFAFPYIMGAPHNWGVKAFWILVGLSVASFAFVILFVPELAGRSLEEVDELFGADLWAWQFKRYETKGLGRRIGALETGGPDEAEAEVRIAEGKTRQDSRNAEEQADVPPSRASSERTLADGREGRRKEVV